VKDTIEVNVIKIGVDWVLVEGRIENQLVRRYIPRVVFVNVKSGQCRIAAYEVLSGIDYNDVSLEALLGSVFPAVRFRFIEDALHEKGIWTRQDYVSNASTIASMLRRLLHRCDATTIINAVARVPEEG